MPLDMVPFTPTNPAHYRKFPPGFGLECIEYVRHLSYAQGSACKYIYRAGYKGGQAEDIAKALWYLEDARLVPAVYLDDYRPDLYSTIDPLAGWRPRAFDFAVTGQFRFAAAALRAVE